MKFKPAVTSILILVLGLCCTVKAQDEDPNLLSLKFTTLNWDGSAIKDLKYLSNGEVHTASAYSRNISLAFPYRGPQLLTFFREEPSTDPENKEPVRVPVGQVNLPRNAKEVLLLFKRVNNDQGREQYGIVPIVQDRDKFTRGSYQIYNFSRYELSGMMGEERFSVAPQRNTLVHVPLEGTQTLRVKIALNNDGEWKMAYRSMWAHKQVNRVNLFIVNGPNQLEPIEIRAFHQYVPTNAEVAAENRSR